MDQTIKARVKKFTYFIGIDVSKNELDYAVMRGNEFLFHEEGRNGPEEITAFLLKLKTLPLFTMTKALFCMENTGFYCNHLLVTLKKCKANVVLENPLQIKHFLSMNREKSDKADAVRIALYAQRNKDDLKLWSPRRSVLLALMHLFTLRNRLLANSVALKTPLQEQDVFTKKKLHGLGKNLCAGTMEAMRNDLAGIDMAIDDLITADAYLKNLMRLITSVDNVGRITALQILISTNEFRDITDPKKFACYSGIAPFKKESGTVIRRSRVSNFANKKIKALLHLCALGAIRYDGELKTYYERKTKNDGKNKILVINAIRNKLILRIFACVRQNRLYCKDYVYSKELTAGKSSDIPS